jgi:hypothetical protein
MFARLFSAIALSTFMVFGTTAVASAADSCVAVALFDMTAAGQGFMGQGGGGFGMMGQDKQSRQWPEKATHDARGSIGRLLSSSRLPQGAQMATLTLGTGVHLAGLGL